MLKIVRQGSLALVIVLAACGSNKPKAPKVDVAEPEQSLEVPPDLIAPQINESMAVPELPGSDLKKTFVLHSDQVRMEREGPVRWLVTKVKPELLWGRLESFWQTQGFALEVKDIQLGVMETEWVQEPASGQGADSVPLRNRYRIRIEPSEDGSEVYISHRAQIQQRVGEKTVWKPFASDPEKEIDMLRRVLINLGLKEQSAVQLLNQPGLTQSKLEIDKKSAQLVIHGEEPDSAVWRRVLLALDRSGYVIGKQTARNGELEFSVDKEKPLRLKLENQNDDTRVVIYIGGGQLKGSKALAILQQIKLHWV